MKILFRVPLVVMPLILLNLMIAKFLVQYSTKIKPTKTKFFHNYIINQLLSAKYNTKIPMDLTLDAKSHDELLSKTHKICSDNLGGAWSKISPSDISLVPISGGMNNLLYRCTLPESTMISNGEPSQVLLRLYGDHFRDDDMSTQLDIFNMLSLKELGPKLYGKFEDGRLEEFLPATSLTSDELTNDEISAIIAKKLAVVHNLDVPLDRNNNWLADRLNEFGDFRKLGPPEFSNDSSDSTKEIAKELLAIDYSREIKFVLDLLDRTESPFVFSHNDLHQGNILLAEYSKRRPNLKERIVFIDFEYCGYNYRAFDIANHFCEWCFEYDTTEYPHFKFSKDKFPSKDIQRNFVRYYSDQNRQLANLSNVRLAKNEALESKSNSCDINDIESTDNLHTNGHSNGIVRETEEDKIMNELEPFFMTTNLLWTLWCISKAHCCIIKFGYWEHAMTRWRLYNNFKRTYLDSQENCDGTPNL